MIMIKNFQELIILINRCESKIEEIDSDILYAVYRKDFRKAAELEKLKKLWYKKILKYIDYFKIRIKENYLEKKVLSNRLSVLTRRYEYHERNNLLY